MAGWRDLRHLDDGSSRPDGNTARHAIAMCLAERAGWGEIQPGHWADSGAVLKTLKERGFTVRRRQQEAK